MKAETLVRRLAILVAGGLAALAAACADEPVAPASDEGTARELSGAAAPEEEIFGLVYNNKSRITSTGYVVKLQEVSGTGACIYHYTSGTPTCLGSQTMQVNPTGIRPGATQIMWGWYNNLDTDQNPCNNGSHAERHDENLDGQPDPGTEKHCVKPGKYIVTLQNGSTLRTRHIDHRLVNGQMGNGKAIEDTTVTSPGASNFKDTIVHFDVVSGASYALQKLDSIAIDNPQTPLEFGPGDSVVTTNVPVRVNSEVTTPVWDTSASIGRLLARVYWDRAQNPDIKSDHWNPDQVVRTHPYSAVDTFEVRIEATTPNKGSDAGTISSKARKVIAQPPTGDQAAPAGNTFPSSMTAGGIASVTLSMKNTGTTTWTSTAGYKLLLFRNTAFWGPAFRSLPSSVSPGGSVTFAFDLRHLEPGVTGTTPAFYKMAKGSTFFGAENGRDILITAPKSGALAAFAATTMQTLSPETVADWIANAEDAGTTKLPVAPDALVSNGTVALEYSYDHEVPRALDIVFAFTFDPQVLEALPIEPAEGAADLVIESGLVAPGEYWVRLTGTVPAGQGLIAGLPFRLVPGAKPPRNREIGTLTLHYPSM